MRRNLCASNGSASVTGSQTGLRGERLESLLSASFFVECAPEIHYCKGFFCSQNTR